MAAKIRSLLEARLGRLLGVEPEILPRLKIGSIVHFILTLIGDGETTGGFNSTMNAVIALIGYELTWDVERNEETEEKPKVVIIN